ncbi:hypothetical protein V6N11_031277 [Hibiscus sabdariffa]|uniref:Putative plant transposon protein domain-containing protein n=1 Tax=Hibiscus sabdariffa TaxID=183260 RepID=A0ABR2SX58_9ROSI
MVRCKNAVGSSQPSPPDAAEIAIFETEAAEERYQQIQSKQLLQEKGFVFSNGERFGLPEEVYDVIVYHGWEKFARHPDEKELQKKSINVTLVKEFYAHFTDPNQGTVYVRSERVEFTARAINKFFAVKRTTDLHTPFVNSLKDQNIDFLLENLCFQGAEWDEANTTVERDRLKPAVKLWMHFLKINLMPTTHTATVNLPRLQLLHSILNSRSINLGQLILDEAFAGISRKQSPLHFPRLITALCRQKGVMEDENDFYIRGRQGIKPSQIPSLMGFDEDATASVPPGGARTIAAARMAELMATTERTQEQLRDMQEKMTSLFHYMRERDEAIQSYFLELLPDEAPLFPIFPNELFHSAQPTKRRAPQEQAIPQPPLTKKKAPSTSTATPPMRPPAPEERVEPATPHADTAASTPKPPAKTATASKKTLTRKDKGKAPVKTTPRAPAPEATVELDSDDDNDEDMPDAPPPPAPPMEPTIPHPRLKRKANRNISTADLAAEENIASEAEDDGSSTTPEETPNPNPPPSKARYKRVATKQAPK